MKDVFLILFNALILGVVLSGVAVLLSGCALYHACTQGLCR